MENGFGKKRMAYPGTFQDGRLTWAVSPRDKTSARPDRQADDQTRHEPDSEGRGHRLAGVVPDDLLGVVVALARLIRRGRHTDREADRPPAARSC